MRFFDFSSDWFKIVFIWKNNHSLKISFWVKICFSDFCLLRYLLNLPRDLAPRACFIRFFIFMSFVSSHILTFVNSCFSRNHRNACLMICIEHIFQNIDVSGFHIFWIKTMSALLFKKYHIWKTIQNHHKFLLVCFLCFLISLSWIVIKL